MKYAIYYREEEDGHIQALHKWGNHSEIDLYDDPEEAQKACNLLQAQYSNARKFWIDVNAEMPKSGIKYRSVKMVFTNCAILTDTGSFNHKGISLEEAKDMLRQADSWESAIGHQSTAEILSELFEIEIPANRIQYKQDYTDIQLVFLLKSRPPEGKILSRAEIEEIGYSFSRIVRL